MSAPLQLVFAGTPQFAALHLESLIAGPHHIKTVMSQPDRPAGRGKRLQPSPVKALALEAGLPVWQPESLKTPESQHTLAALEADVLVVVAYGLILPANILAIPRLGCLNVHASLLPRWRGAAPVQRAIETGDQETGVSIMLMEPGLDTGPVLLTSRLPILAHHTSGTLLEDLAALGDVLAIDQTGQEVQDPVSKKMVRLPDTRAGVLMVFAVYDRASFGLVLEATRALRVGDKLVNP